MASWAFKFTSLPEPFVNSIPSLPIRIDAPILAGCIQPVPWVKALMRTGSNIISTDHLRIGTYVQDVGNVSAGSGPEVQDTIMKCALAFNSLLVVMRKFVLSSKSATVASDRKLAIRVANKMASHGTAIQVCDATRDLGVMFVAGVHRNQQLAKVRLSKAQTRAKRIIRVSTMIRAARKLFTSGAFPQAVWGHQCSGLTDFQSRTMRRMAASSIGVSIRSQRCLTSCVFVCFGRCGDLWQKVMKELVMMWSQLMLSAWPYPACPCVE